MDYYRARDAATTGTPPALKMLPIVKVLYCAAASALGASAILFIGLQMQDAGTSGGTRLGDFFIPLAGAVASVLLFASGAALGLLQRIAEAVENREVSK